MKKCLITGIAGFIGSHLADYLIKKGYSVIGIDNLLTGDIHNINSRVKRFYKNDVTNLKSLTTILTEEKPSYIFHLSAIARTLCTIEDPLYTHNVNVTGTLNVLECARLIKPIKVVFASSNIVYAENTPYFVSKKSAELYMKIYDKLYNIPTVSLRFSNVYGSLRQSEKGSHINVLAALRKSKRKNGYIEITGDGNQSRDFTHVADVVHAIYLSAIKNAHGDEIDICTGTNTTMNKIASYFNCPIKYVPERLGDIKHIYQNPAKAKRLLGFRATRQLADHINIYTT